MANDHKGSSGNLGDPVVSIEHRRLEIPPTNSRLIHGSASGAGGDEPRTQRWYRQAKETKRGEMGGRESQHLIVPLKRGNQPEGPRQGKGVPSHEPLKRNLRLPAIMPPKRGTYIGPLRAATPPPAEGRRCSSLTRRRGLWA